MTFALKDVCSIAMGQAPPGSSYNDNGHGLPLIAGAGDLGMLHPNPSRHTTAASRRSKRGDIILCIRATIGDRNWSDKEYCLGRGVAGLSADPERLDRRYLWHWLGVSRYELARHGRGSTFKQVNRAAIEEHEIPLPTKSDGTPDIDEQRRIASILDMADTIRRQRQEAIRLSEELLRSAFLEMFGDPATNPMGWDVEPLGKCCLITTGNTPPRSNPNYYGDHVEWIKSDNVNTVGHLLTRATEWLSETGMAVGRTVKGGSVLMTCIAGSRSSIGKVAIVDRKVAFNQQINALTPRSNVDYRFLYVQLLLAKRLVQAVSTDSMKGLVTKGRLQEVAVPVPPLPLQQRFVRTFEQILKTKHCADDALDRSHDLFNSLVQRAFRGEL
jgi:type I restriction enzyme, S subunit